jgi:hypothetical protein
MGKIAWTAVAAWAVRAFTRVFDGRWRAGDLARADRPIGAAFAQPAHGFAAGRSRCDAQARL